MNNLAISLKNTEQYFKAEQIYKRIIKLNPSYINVYNNYGNLKSSINDIEKAINLYNQGINIAKEKNINSLVFLNHLAAAFQSLNKLTETIETVNKILKINDLYEKLKSKFPENAQKVDSKNPRRIIRAFELGLEGKTISRKSKKNFSNFFDKGKTFRPKKKFQPGTLKYSLHKQAQASLNSGINLREVSLYCIESYPNTPFIYFHIKLIVVH